jgi:hypothetical protein
MWEAHDRYATRKQCFDALVATAESARAMPGGLLERTATVCRPDDKPPLGAINRGYQPPYHPAKDN